MADRNFCSMSANILDVSLPQPGTPTKKTVIGSLFIHAKVLNMNKFSCMFFAPSFTAKLIDLEREEATKKP